MYTELEILYNKGSFKEAKQLIDSIETNTVTLRMLMDLRLKESDWGWHTGKM